MSQTLQIQGVGPLATKLRALGPKVAKKVIRKGVRKGGAVIRKAERGDAPLGATGLLRKTIAVAAAKRAKGTIAVTIFPRPKAYAKAGKPYYGPFVIQGHRVRGPSGRRVPPDDFVARGFARARERAAQAAIESIRAGIQQAWRER